MPVRSTPAPLQLRADCLADFSVARRHLAAAHGEAVGRVVEQPVPAPLRFEHQREVGVAFDLEGGDVVRLHGDCQRHEIFPFACGQRVSRAGGEAQSCDE